MDTFVLVVFAVGSLLQLALVTTSPMLPYGRHDPTIVVSPHSLSSGPTSGRLAQDRASAVDTSSCHEMHMYDVANAPHVIRGAVEYSILSGIM